MKFLLTLVLATQVSLVFAATPPTPRPNILFIFSDDHAQHAISAYGSKVNRTPHLDRLGAAGIRFNHAFVTNSICTPSRAVVLTGKYSHANGTPVFNVFDGAQPTVAKMLQASGYHTGMIEGRDIHPFEEITDILEFVPVGHEVPTDDDDDDKPARPTTTTSI